MNAMTPFKFELERWKEYADLITDSLWKLGARARGEGRSGTYHGNFVPQIPDQIMRRFTEPGETVVDLFAGSGTTLVECLKLGRHGVGVELLPHIRKRTAAHLAKQSNPFGVDVRLVEGDSCDPSTREQLPESAAHVFLHPPYWDIITFSSNKLDLSTAKTLEAFLERFAGVVDNAYRTLAPGRLATLVIADMYRRATYLPLGFECMDVMRSRGFELRAINVKDMQGNEKGAGGQRAGLWRYRSFKHGLYVFKHEYVMLFRRPVKEPSDLAGQITLDFSSSAFSGPTCLFEEAGE